MTSFSCPHFAQHRDWCQKLDDWCVPGRPGCVIPKTTVFAVPWQQRLQAKRCASVAANTPAVTNSAGVANYDLRHGAGDAEPSDRREDILSPTCFAPP